MSDMSICKHNQPTGYCDQCSPNWQIDLIKADAADDIFRRGYERAVKDLQESSILLERQIFVAVKTLNAILDILDVQTANQLAESAINAIENIKSGKGE